MPITYNKSKERYGMPLYRKPENIFREIENDLNKWRDILC